MRNSWLILLIAGLTQSAVALAEARPYFYRVPAGENLISISILNYGKQRMRHKIIEWNHLKAPYKIRAGQKLILRQKPIPTELGHSKLLDYYRIYLSLPHRKARIDHQFVAAKRTRARAEARASSKAKALAKDLALKSPPALPPPPPPIPVEQLKREQYKVAVADLAEGDAAADESADENTALLSGPAAQRGIGSIAPIAAVATPTKPDAPPLPKVGDDPRTADQLFRDGKHAQDRGDLVAAVQFFNESRNKDQDQMPVWLFQIRTLRQLKRNDEAKDLAKAFISQHPEMEHVPFLKSASEGAP